MGATVFYLLMLQKYISFKHVILKYKYIYIYIYPLFLKNTSNDFTANNLKKTGLSDYVYECSVDYNIIDNSNTIDNQKYLMKKHDIKVFLELLKNVYCIIT